MRKNVLLIFLTPLAIAVLLLTCTHPSIAAGNDDFQSSSAEEGPSTYLHAKFLDTEGALAVEFGPETLPIANATNVLQSDTYDFCPEWQAGFATFKNHPNYSSLPQVFDEFTNFLELQVIGEMICGSPNPDLDNMLTALGAAQRQKNEATFAANNCATACLDPAPTTSLATTQRGRKCGAYLKKKSGDVFVSCEGWCKNYYRCPQICFEKGRKHHRCTCPMNKVGGAHYPPIPCTCGGKCAETVTISGHVYRKDVPCRRFYLSIPDCDCKIDADACID